MAKHKSLFSENQIVHLWIGMQSKFHSDVEFFPVYFQSIHNSMIGLPCPNQVIGNKSNQSNSSLLTFEKIKVLPLNIYLTWEKYSFLQKLHKQLNDLLISQRNSEINYPIEYHNESYSFIWIRKFKDIIQTILHKYNSNINNISIFHCINQLFTINYHKGADYYDINHSLTKYEFHSLISQLDYEISKVKNNANKEILDMIDDPIKSILNLNWHKKLKPQCILNSVSSAGAMPNIGTGIGAGTANINIPIIFKYKHTDSNRFNINILNQAMMNIRYLLNESQDNLNWDIHFNHEDDLFYFVVNEFSIDGYSNWVSLLFKECFSQLDKVDITTTELTNMFNFIKTLINKFHQGIVISLSLQNELLSNEYLQKLQWDLNQILHFTFKTEMLEFLRQSISLATEKISPLFNLLTHSESLRLGSWINTHSNLLFPKNFINKSNFINDGFYHPIMLCKRIINKLYVCEYEYIPIYMIGQLEQYHESYKGSLNAITQCLQMLKFELEILYLLSYDISSLVYEQNWGFLDDYLLLIMFLTDEDAKPFMDLIIDFCSNFEQKLFQHRMAALENMNNQIKIDGDLMI